MKRDIRKKIIEQRIKKVTSLQNELEEIQIAQSNLGYLKLEKPIRDGWYKTLKLRDDIKNNKHSKTYQEILDAVLVEVWGREKKYADKSWKSKFSKWPKNYQRPGIKYLHEHEFNKLSSRAKKHFFPRVKYGSPKYSKYYVCILPRYFFIPSYRRAFIVSRKVISPVLNSREQEILEILQYSKMNRYSIYSQNHCKLYYDPSKAQRRKANMEMASIITSYDFK